MRFRHVGVGLVVFAALAGCTGNSSSQRAPETDGGLVLPDGPAIHVLFLGNSLTAGNDLPAIVQAMAAALGSMVTGWYRVHSKGGMDDTA